MVDDPINVATGDTYLQDDDYIDPVGWLTFRRFYNNDAYTGVSAAGIQWRHSFDRLLGFSVVNGQNQITLFRPDGRQEFFTQINGQWTADPDSPDRLTETDNAQGSATSYTVFIAALRQFETYSANYGQLQSIVDVTGRGVGLSYSGSQTPTSVAPHTGLLLKVTDSQGRQLNFTYDSNGYLRQTILPDGQALTYSHDSNGNLTSVAYPDTTTRQYVYNESSLNGGTSQPYAMTGIVDEANVRYESTAFNSAGQAISVSAAGNAGTTQVTYNSDGTSTVKYPLGASITMGFAVVNGVVKAASINQPCGAQCGLYWTNRTFDAQGNPASSTDFNGNVTKTTYDANGLLDQQIDASGTPNQRTTNTTWNSTLRVPLTRTVLDANNTAVSSTQWVYNAAGQTQARCEIDPANSAASGYACSASGTVPAGVRRWTYTYCTAVDTTQCPLVGLLLTATGPRTDLTQTTSYSYYMSASAVSCGTPGAACHQPGDLYQVTDALGHVTTIASYDADGRTTRETDANGINTDLTYTPRGWLASRTVGGAQTSFSYTPYGAVSSVTDPDGITTSYGYDAAHRLTKITDAQGNYLQYTLDAAGNKTAEQVFDSSGTAHKSLSRTFNPLGQLTTVVDGLSHTVFNASAAGSYDANGNLVQSSDGLGIQRQSSYDALDRLVQTIDNYNGTN
ncbi:DUF6531 domain-containing protein [Dyella agri]|uniref:DUF6531 domain-containing protein n=1 Tax=Dyella agri TaxID=1926869 RepID=UPI00384D2EB1